MKRRITFDRQGRPVIELRNSDGIYERERDAAALDRLNVKDLTVTTGLTRATGIHRMVGSNPYGSSIEDAKKLKKRSGLDYMRALSEEIKRRKLESGE